MHATIIHATIIHATPMSQVVAEWEPMGSDGASPAHESGIKANLDDDEVRQQDEGGAKANILLSLSHTHT
jgi:hypothetical protein